MKDVILIKRGIYMGGKKEVWKLFQVDPVCWILVSIYENLRFPFYALFTFSYLFIIPLLLNFVFYNKLPDFASFNFIRFFSIYGILPILGSYLGYKWLSSIFHSFDKLSDERVLDKKSYKSVKDNLIKNCNRIVFIPLSLALLACVIYKNSDLSTNFISNFYLLVVSSLWWYFLIKTAFVCLITFFAYRNLLMKKGVGGKYVLKVSLYHPDTFYGLKSIGTFCINFLVLYIVVIGSYLVFSIWRWDEAYSMYKLLYDPFILFLLAAYLIIPVCGFFWVGLSSHKRIEAAKYEELDRLWEEIKSINRKKEFQAAEYARLIALYDRTKSYPAWPVNLKKGATLFSVYWTPFISFCAKIFKATPLK